MRVSKFLIISVLATMVALGYVHQQVEFLKLNYAFNRNQGSLLVLLDQNSTLVYNVNSLQTPLYIEQKLSEKEASWEIPERWYTIGEAYAAR